MYLLNQKIINVGFHLILQWIQVKFLKYVLKKKLPNRPPRRRKGQRRIEKRQVIYTPHYDKYAIGNPERLGRKKRNKASLSTPSDDGIDRDLPRADAASNSWDSLVHDTNTETNVPKGPVLMSYRDPEISEEERLLRKYGKGRVVNPVGSDRAKRTDLRRWLGPNPGGNDAEVDEGVRLCSSPFSFGFSL